uniref:Non-selective voltage-gated ion channel VDAC3 n=1 Tax=Balaenoptera musculus TaxID=9771 RepID=A0A8C0DL12_BALMU
CVCTPRVCMVGPEKSVNKRYGFGMVKIDLRTKSCSGVEFSTSGHAYTDTGKASGNLETKYKICNYGLTFTQKWNTDNTLGKEISLENKLCGEGQQEGFLNVDAAKQRQSRW